MKIQFAKVIVTCPGRNFVTLKIETDQGVYGIGDATLNGRELSVVSYLEDHVTPCLIGMDPRRIEDIWQYLYKGAYWRRGPVTMRAIAAVDMALWDIKAKMAGMPLYDCSAGGAATASWFMATPMAATSPKRLRPSANISTWATRRSARRPVFRGLRTPTGSVVVSSTTNQSGDDDFLQAAAVLHRRGLVRRRRWQRERRQRDENQARGCE
jgi:L-alanine-DL-glutamate epimerase-like enolase superfamily enzyme